MTAVWDGFTGALPDRLGRSAEAAVLGGILTMCGIVGYVGFRRAADLVVEGLRRLEYRGYDSAGVATVTNGRLWVRKDAGKLAEVNKKHGLDKLPGNVAIGHVRWATHGSPTAEWETSNGGQG